MNEEEATRMIECLTEAEKALLYALIKELRQPAEKSADTDRPTDGTA